MNLAYKLLRSVYMLYIVFLNYVVTYIPFLSVRCFLIRHLYFVKMGEGTQIGMGVKFRRPRSIVIGKNCLIHNDVFLDGLGTLTIGDNVDIGDQVMTFCGGHDVQDPEYPGIPQAITIGDRACLFARAMIIEGIEIGEGAVVAAGGVVRKDVPPYTIVGGVPAKKIGDRNRNLTYELNPRFVNKQWR